MKKLTATVRWPRMHVIVAVIAAFVIVGGYGLVEAWRANALAAAKAAEPKGLPAPAAPAIVQAQLTQQPSPPVPVVRPRTQSVTDYVEITGNAAAVNAVKLVARVEGYLDRIHYEDGQPVKKATSFSRYSRTNTRISCNKHRLRSCSSRRRWPTQRPSSFATPSW